MAGIYDELWVRVSDFSPCSRLPLVCRALRDVLRGRHVGCVLRQDTMDLEIARIKAHRAPATLWLKCVGDGGDETAAHFDRLTACDDWDCPPVMTLVLNRVRLSDKGLETLRFSHRLMHLSLDVGNNSLSRQGVDALVTQLNTVPGLQELRLLFGAACISLWANDLQSLQPLHAPHLSTLVLDLSSNYVPYSQYLGLIPVAALTALDLRLPECRSSVRRISASDVAGQLTDHLLKATQLQSLSLTLSQKELGDDGMVALAQLRSLQELRTLTLNLEKEEVTARGALALADLRDCAKLRSLTLDLSGNNLEADGAQSLALLLTSRTITALKLRLRSTNLGDEGVRRFIEDGATSGLEGLALHLGGNSIGQAGAKALAGLASFPNLRCLDLDLSINGVDPEGAVALSRLLAAPGLHDLSLNLLHNKVRRAGALELVQAAGARAVPLALRLTLASNGLASPERAELRQQFASLPSPRKQLTL